MTMFKAPIDERLGVYTHLIVHCSATQNKADVGSREIDRWHRERGFRKCGYHVVIPASGFPEYAEIGFPTRRIDEVGAHVGDCGPGWNRKSFGVCLVGGVNNLGSPVDNFFHDQFVALKTLMIRFLHSHPRQSVMIMGHRDLIRVTNAPPKACPCFDVQSWVKREEIFKQVEYRDLEDAKVSAVPNRMRVPEFAVIGSGDTYSLLALRWGLTVQEIRDLNPSIDETRLQIGSRVRLWNGH